MVESAKAADRPPNYSRPLFFLKCPNAKPRSLSGLGNQSENSAVRDQILPVSKVNSCSIDRENGEI